MLKKFLITVVIVAAALLAGAFYFRTMPVLTAPSGGETLLVIEADGGMCVYGGCYAKTTIRGDGSYLYESGGGERAEGALPAETARDLRELIATADFPAIRSRPFMDLCPSAYNGAELIYTFYPSGNRISACEYDLDENSPLWKAIGGALSLVYSSL